MDPLTDALRALTSGRRDPLPEVSLSESCEIAEPKMPRDAVDRVIAGIARSASEDQIRMFAQEIMEVAEQLGLTLDQRLWFSKAALPGVAFTPEQTEFIKRFYVEKGVYHLYWRQQSDSEIESLNE